MSFGALIRAFFGLFYLFINSVCLVQSFGEGVSDFGRVSRASYMVVEPCGLASSWWTEGGYVHEQTEQLLNEKVSPLVIVLGVAKDARCGGCDCKQRRRSQNLQVERKNIKDEDQ